MPFRKAGRSGAGIYPNRGDNSFRFRDRRPGFCALFMRTMMLLRIILPDSKNILKKQ